MKYFLKSLFLFSLLCVMSRSFSQYTHEDTLRGSITPERAWWDVQRYNISVTPDYASRTISGSCEIIFTAMQSVQRPMQIDLQQPMVLDSAILKGHPLSLQHTSENVWLVETGQVRAGGTESLHLFFHGMPREAVKPPWDGGWIWKKDAKGRPWMSVACQGLGASVWYPCKDHQSDEPDQGASLTINVADTLVAVGNGRLIDKRSAGRGLTSWTWEVKNPINNYDIIPYIGKYVTWHDEFTGEKGKLDLNYWVLDYNIEKAKAQFGRDVKPMLSCFENWFGPYPFYEDGYKLVESPHLGMEHQSAVAYGNQYRNGYLGMDLSGSGWGTKWDYIIVHESGHEWFGNSITSKDIADMWVHEGFTDYSEPLFVECQYGKAAADAYCQGLRRNINNDKPVIGPYNVNMEGSGDMYAKGANLLHTIRQVINDDSKFRNILRGLNRDFYHKTTTSAEVEAYISRQSGIDFSKVFDQYLRTTRIPTLEYRVNGNALSYRWADVVPGFAMPVKVILDKKEKWLTPGTAWQTETVKVGISSGTLTVDANFYVNVSKVR